MIKATKIMENIKILGFPSNKEYKQTEFQGEAFVDANFLIHKLHTTHGVSGAPNLELVD